MSDYAQWKRQNLRKWEYARLDAGEWLIPFHCHHHFHDDHCQSHVEVRMRVQQVEPKICLAWEVEMYKGLGVATDQQALLETQLNDILTAEDRTFLAELRVFW